MSLRRCFLIAVSAFFIAGLFVQLKDIKSNEKVKIYVKDSRTGKLVIHRTKIPRTESNDEKLFWVLKELISGPTSNHYERLFSPDIEIQNIVIRGGIAYISFGWNLIDSLQKEPVLALRSITKSVFTNIRGLKGIKILIEGIEPVSTYSAVKLSSTFFKPL
jgi:spore germination protein GerM